MLRNITLSFILFGTILFPELNLFAQNQSVAKTWNKELLHAIRNDFARPPVHARNLFHTSIAMYDAWAAYNPEAETFFLGQDIGGFHAEFEGVPVPNDVQSAQEEAMSVAVYRLIAHRFQNSPGAFFIMQQINNTIDSLGYDVSNTSQDYINGGATELGNYIANRLIAFGYQDGSNEINAYANQYYEPVHDVIEVEEPGNPNMIDPNRWQAISLSVAIDQAGNLLTSDPPHLAPEWGNVTPFALADSVKNTYSRDGNNYQVYHDPGEPAFLDTLNPGDIDDFYKWNFAMVSVWQSHLDTADGVYWDVSPASVGNISENLLPENNLTEYADFYNYFEGGDASQGYALNPITGQPYEPQLVKRGDYARILAEFWADGPDSETPPGHWFNIYNEISEHPLYEKKWAGEGDELDELEYDVKAYLTLGGAMHDAAISAWSTKGWYDYVRPVSAIRYMADRGQSTDDNLANYHPQGIPLMPGYIETVEEGDPLAGDEDEHEHVGKIKLYTWRGPDYIDDPEEDMSGVGWILAENWWPYQRPTFVTPPFAGYVSGHSTYSRTAAEIMTYMTGDEYFPGGMSNFVAPKNEFLEFEQGPSDTIILQWATYRDASDQCSLSRIWGGIHPPIDDIPGRKMGIKIGQHAFMLADELFSTVRPLVDTVIASQEVINLDDVGEQISLYVLFGEEMDTGVSPTVFFLNEIHPLLNSLTLIQSEWLDNQTFELVYQVLPEEETLNDVVVQIRDAENLNGVKVKQHVASQPFRIDKQRPVISELTVNQSFINDDVTETSLVLEVSFSEPCNTTQFPEITFESSADLSQTLVLDTQASQWENDMTFTAVYTIEDNDETILDIDLLVSEVYDLAGNAMEAYGEEEFLVIDTRNPELLDFNVSQSLLNISDVGNQAINFTLTFDKEMNTSVTPALQFPEEDLSQVLNLSGASSQWLNEFTCQIVYHLQSTPVELALIDVSIEALLDTSGNRVVDAVIPDVFSIDTKRPQVVEATASSDIIADADVGNGIFTIQVSYDEPMDTEQVPIVELHYDGGLLGDVQYNVFSSEWFNDMQFEANYLVIDNNVEVDNIELRINFARDQANNSQSLRVFEDWITLDTKNPYLLSLTANTYVLTSDYASFELIGVFNEAIMEGVIPELQFESSAPVQDFLLVDPASEWLNSSTYRFFYTMQDQAFYEEDIDVRPVGVFDLAGNEIENIIFENFFSIQFEPLSVQDHNPFHGMTLFPNPVESGGQLFLHAGEGMSDFQLQIVNQAGQLVFTKNINGLNRGVSVMEVPNLSAGIYVIKAVSGNYSNYWKLVINK